MLKKTILLFNHLRMNCVDRNSENAWVKSSFQLKRAVHHVSTQIQKVHYYLMSQHCHCDTITVSFHFVVASSTLCTQKFASSYHLQYKFVLDAVGIYNPDASPCAVLIIWIVLHNKVVYRH